MRRFQTVVAAILIGLAAWSGSGAASAQTGDPKAALARDMVVAMDLEGTVRGMFETMAPMVAAGAAQELRLSGSEQARFAEILSEEFQSASPEFVQALVQVYADNLSEQELRDIVTFLRSPSGQAMRRVEARAKGELERAGQTIGMRVALQAMVRFNEERSRR